MIDYIKDIEQLNQELMIDLVTNRGEPSEGLIDKSIIFELKLPFIIIKDDVIEVKIASFFKCQFYCPVIFKNINQNITFEDCIFHSDVIAYNVTFKYKARFRNCEFKNNVNFRNTTFNGLADFWNSKFYKKTIFIKTDFLDTTVFSGVTFKENILFTYTLIDKLLLLRGAVAEKGFDLSLAIISGELGLFDFNLDDFKTIDVNKYVNSQLKGRKFKTNQDRKEAYIEIYENKYEKSVSENAEIPTKNKRETYRIIKQNYEKQNNIVASLDFKKLEKNTLLDELRLRNFSFTNRANRFILWLNKWSNNYGTSIFRSLILIFVIGSIPFFFSIMETDIFHYSWSIDWESFKTGVKYYTQYLIPTHKTNYVGNTNPTIGYFIFDFIGRIIIGYGIYQFIQAFRKYR